MKKHTWLGIVVLVVAIGVILFVARGRSGKERQIDSPSNVSAQPAQTSAKTNVKTPTKDPRQKPPRTLSTTPTGQLSAPSSGQGGEEESAPATEKEQRERAEEALVAAFDALTDKWMKPAADGKGVTMEDVRHFAEQFRKVPKKRRDECLHRALNLVPDENVMLLAGILMDKTLDKAILETVYNDVLNRDESVKKPILQQIFKDREHPCWADTAWILDVTGERPAKKQAP
jgi:hypothetical protein